MIRFPEHEVVCIFPDQTANLDEAISTLGLEDGYPVIVLIGGEIPEEQAVVTRGAIETPAKIVKIQTPW